MDIAARARGVGMLAVVALAGTAASAATILPVNLSFTHRLGGLVPARQIMLEVWELDDFSDDDFVGNHVTGNNGQALIVTNMDDGPFDSTLELYANVISRAPGFARVNPRALGSTPYSYRSPGGAGWYDATIDTINGPVNLVSPDNNTYSGASYGILMPMVYTAQYFSGAFGISNNEIEVLYDSTDAVPGTASTGNFYMPIGQAENIRLHDYINIDKGDWGSWDVIGHEYCHFIAHYQGLNPGYGGGHIIGLTNIPAGATVAQKQRGVGLAWNEGIATFMYQMGVQGGINASFDNQLSSRDYDTWYTDFDAPGSTAGSDQVTFEYDLETIGYHTRNGMGALGQHLTSAESRGEGEGDELPVQRVLWDLYDPTGEAHTGNHFTGFRRAGRSDKANFGVADTWQHALKGPENAPNSVTGNQSFMAAWDDITAYLGTNAGKAGVGLAAGDTKAQAVTRVGEILEEHTIAAMPTFGTTDLGNPLALLAATTNDTTPRLSWTEQNAGLTDIYRLLVFKSDWSLQWDSGNLIDNTIDAISNFLFDVPAADALPNGQYFWAVLTNPDLRQLADLRDDDIGGGVLNQADWYKYYWSGANAFIVVPTPGGVVVLAAFALGMTRRRRA